MTTRATPWLRVTASGVIAVVRLNEPLPFDAATALVTAGVSLIEVTLTTPGALATIERIASEVVGAVVGAGTVLDPSTARDAIAAGAQFVVSPALDENVVRLCRDDDVLCIPGAFTPTEMLRAWHAGAELIKVFPSSQVGPTFFRDVLAPMPFLRLVPSGGVSPENAADWIRAGATAVSVGTSLVNARTVQEQHRAILIEHARALVAAVAGARHASTVQV